VLANLSPQRRRLAVGAGALALVLAVVAAAAARTSRRTPAVTPDTEVPIVVVPGYGGDAGSVATLAAHLESLDRPVHVVELPALGTGPLGESGRALDRAVDRLEVSKVDLVGFSAGGVVIRHWVAELGGDDLARRVVTLGSPHHGVDLAARLGGLSAADCRGACADLRPGSQAIRDLNADDETPGDASWTTIRTTGDEVVTPIDSALLAGATNLLIQDLCPGESVSHGGLAGDPLPLALTLAAVDGRPPTAVC
jgi:triacylglycerol lipase